MPDTKPTFIKKVTTGLLKTWKFLNGHKTKIGTVIYFANEYLGGKLPDNWQEGLSIAAQLVVALGLVHGVSKKGKQFKNNLKNKANG